MKSPHHFLYIVCSPQTARRLNGSFTRVKPELHPPLWLGVFSTHGRCMPASSTLTTVLIFSANPGISTSPEPAALNVTRRTVPVKRSCSSSSCISWKRVWSISSVCKGGGSQHQIKSECWAVKWHCDAYLFTAVKLRQRHRKEQHVLSRWASGTKWKELTPLFHLSNFNTEKEGPSRRATRALNQEVNVLVLYLLQGYRSKQLLLYPRNRKVEQAQKSIFVLNTYFWKRPVYMIPLQELQIGLILYSSGAQGRSSASGTIFATVGRQHFTSQLCKIICCFLQPPCDKV